MLTVRWLASPNYFNKNNANEWSMNTNGNMNNNNLGNANGVRPAISNSQIFVKFIMNKSYGEIWHSHIVVKQVQFYERKF